MVDLSNSIAAKYNIHNVNFIHANITEIDFSSFNAFYFYNSFQENIESEAKIDESIETNMKYYGYYCYYVNSELAKNQLAHESPPIGVR